jgi:hypothetical protein
MVLDEDEDSLGETYLALVFTTSLFRVTERALAFAFFPRLVRYCPPAESCKNIPHRVLRSSALP